LFDSFPPDAYYEPGRIRNAAASEYLRLANSLLEILFTLIHLTAGQPARATELVTTRIKNFGAERRSLFVTNGTPFTLFFPLSPQIPTQANKRIKQTNKQTNKILFFLSSTLGGIMLDILYNKTQALTAFAPMIMRFLPAICSKLLFLYLTYIRPVEVFFIAAIADNQAQINASNYLLCSEGKRWTAEKARNVFCRVTGFGILWSEYRHVAIAFMRHMNVPSNLKDYLPVDEQSGHGQETAERVYGIATSDSHTRTDLTMRG
jgi:hypothetical protein